jgi:NTE family protein
MPSRPPRRASTPPALPALDLALQGGGSHGAFTWGVLDRLLEDLPARLDGVSGTSAGALNAAVLATGLAQGGPERAREALRAFWADVARAGDCFGRPDADERAPRPGLALDPVWTAPLMGWWQAWLRLFSPSQLNPWGLNPLRDIVERHVDVQALREGPLQVFVTATAVHTGQPRVFDRHDLSIDALMASACLPHLFPAVMIDGEPYWDGGYSGNPALWPLIYQTSATDVMLVKINPLVRAATPMSVLEIADRASEITFNAALVGEMRAIAFVRRLLAEERLPSDRYKSLRLHMIADEKVLAGLPASTKLSTDAAQMERLFDAGRDAAAAWLARHRSDLGRRNTLDVEAAFLSPRRATDAA